MARHAAVKFDPNEFAATAAEHGSAIRGMDQAVAERRDLQVLKELDSVPFGRIGQRPGGDLRMVSLAFVVETLAPSIAGVGLIHPVVVDQDYCLVAGAHRLAACTLLAMDPQARKDWVIRQVIDGFLVCDPNKAEHYGNLAQLLDHKPGMLVQVRVVQINSDNDLQQAIEIAENEVRRDFTREELLKIKEVLEQRGYSFGGQGGRPTKEQSEVPRERRLGVMLISQSFHKSERQVRRLLAPPKEPKAPTGAKDRMVQALKVFLLSPEASDVMREWAEQGLELLEDRG